MKNKLHKFEIYKEQMKTGDLIQWCENQALMGLYRKVINSEEDHSSIILRIEKYNKHIFVTEARIKGTVVSLLERRLSEFNGNAWWYRLKDDWDTERNKIASKALEMIGLPFSFLSIAKAIMRLKLKGFFNSHWSREPGFIYCSEYCYLAYESTGKLEPLRHPTHPNDIPKLGIFNERIQIL